MKYKIPSLMCFLLAIILIVSPINTKAMEVTESGQQGVSVKASIEPSFVVSLPANIELQKSGNTATCTQQIGVKGDIQVSGSVSVEASPNFTMYDVSLRPAGDTTTPSTEDDQNGYPHKDPVAATATQSAVIWPYSELKQLSAGTGFTYDGDTGFHNTDMSIEVTNFTAGKWEGLVNFDISYDNGLTLAPGLYNTEGVMTASWDELVADGTITVSDGVATANNDGSDNNQSTDVLVGKLIIPNSVTSIDNNAFAYCRNLTSVTVPDSVTSIGNNAFENCENLESVTIPDSVTSIGNVAFYCCESLTSVTIPDSVTSISDSTFLYCTGLTSVTIPDSVTSIGNSAFSYCTGLTSLTIPNSVTSIGDNAFYLVTNVAYQGLAGGSPWGAKAVNGYIEGDFVYSGSAKTTLCAYTGNDTSVTVPDSVTSIGNNAFCYCSGLTSITIPDSVTSIGSSAFKSCSSLTSVIFDNPQGWYVGDSAGVKTTALNGSDLSNESTAATCLNSTYKANYWTRE